MNKINLNKEEYIDFIRRRITELRIKKNVSEYQMSYDLGKSKGYIQSISSGATLPSMDAFIDICGYFDITPIEFFDSEIHNPDKLKEITEYVKKLPEKDIDLLMNVLQRYFEIKSEK